MSGAAEPPTCPRCRLPDLVLQVDGVVASRRDHIAWELAAPPLPGSRPQRRRPSRALVWLLLTLVPLDLGLLVVFAAFAILVGVVIGGVALVVLAAYLVQRLLNREAIARRKEAERAAEAAVRHRYQHALAYWYQLRLCGRCRGVFLPGHPWQHDEVLPAGALAAPAHAWLLAQQLADHADRFHRQRSLPTR